jgi:hypothetical protein
MATIAHIFYLVQFFLFLAIMGRLGYFFLFTWPYLRPFHTRRLYVV